jgi:hypothetical protein
LQRISARHFQDVYAVVLLDNMKKENVASLALTYIKMISDLKMRLTGERKQKLDAVIRNYQNMFPTNKKIVQGLQDLATYLKTEDYASSVAEFKVSDKILEKRDIEISKSEPRSNPNKSKLLAKPNNQLKKPNST